MARRKQAPNNDNSPASMLDAALAYAAKGWPLLPIRSGGKEPLIDGWEVNATTDATTIKRWLKKWPNANMALHVGDAGLLVIDYDPGSDRAEVEGNIGKFPATKLVAKTPRGGTHEYYALQPGELVANSANKLAPHVDVRSFHGYVLLPPSRTTDGTYEWISEGKPAFRTDEMLRVANTAREKSQDRDNWIIEPDLEENVATCITWLKDKAKIAIEGQGGDSCAYATAAMCKSYGISEERAIDLMLEYWNPRCDPPWSWNEQEHLVEKVRNAFAYNTSIPGNLTPAYREAEKAQGFKPVPKPALQVGEHEVIAGRFRFVDRDGIEEIAPPNWLIRDTAPEGGYMMMFGAPGTFKTFIALDVALSVASGRSETPYGKVEASGAALFAVGEGRSNHRARITAWEQVHNGGKKVRNFVLADPVPSVTEDWATFIEGALKLHPEGYKIVVIDTVGRSMQGADENTQKDASLLTKRVETLQRQLGATVLALHHTGHGNTDREKGSVESSATADTRIAVKRAEGDYIAALTMWKQKDAAEWPDACFGKGWRYLKLSKVSTPIGETLVVVKAGDGEIPKSPAQDNTEHARNINAGYILAALRSAPGKEWKASELAGEARKRGCQIAFSTLRTDVLHRKKGKPGWARTHPWLTPYYQDHKETWATPFKLPPLDPAFALPDDEAEG